MWKEQKKIHLEFPSYYFLMFADFAKKGESWGDAPENEEKGKCSDLFCLTYVQKSEYLPMLILSVFLLPFYQ